MMTENCGSCGESEEGGIYTNGDGFGDAKHIGIVPPPFRRYCWDCELPNLADEINKAFQDKGWCGFLEAWVGRCREENPCVKHSSQLCWSCKRPAKQNCEHTGMLVCGMPECLEHPHVHEALFYL